MDYVKSITTAAKLIKISSHLLLAICTHESGLKNISNFNDKGSPSIGVCQVKKNTAISMGFSGSTMELMDPRLNALIAAHYLKYQEDRYHGDWIKMVASYNSGTYHESESMPGCPRNLKYIKAVRSHLPEELKENLICERWATEMVRKFKVKKRRK